MTKREDLVDKLAREINVGKTKGVYEKGEDKTVGTGLGLAYSEAESEAARGTVTEPPCDECREKMFSLIPVIESFTSNSNENEATLESAAQSMNEGVVSSWQFYEETALYWLFKPGYLSMSDSPFLTGLTASEVQISFDKAAKSTIDEIGDIGGETVHGRAVVERVPLPADMSAYENGEYDLDSVIVDPDDTAVEALPEDAVEILRDIADGVDAAHENDLDWNKDKVRLTIKYVPAARWQSTVGEAY